MIKLLAITLSLIHLSANPNSVTIDIDTSVVRIWAEVELTETSISIVQWGT